MRLRILPKLAMVLVSLWLVQVTLGQERRAPAGYRDWKAAGGGPDNIHYSTLAEINRENVHEVATAWTHDTGDAYADSEMQCNPVIIDGVLYATTPKLRLIALDAATGKLRWSFDPNEGEKVSGKLRNRAVNYWAEGSDRRVFYAVRQYLCAIDATTGKPIASFGKS